MNQLHLLLQVDAGPPQELIVTAHRLDAPFSPVTGYVAPPKKVAAHPLLADLAMLGKTKPNPWKTKKKTTAELTIEAGKNLTYSTRVLRVKAGESVKLTFQNPDVVPHNWVLVQPGQLSTVGSLANKLIADPEAYARQYVPASEQVLVYTDIVSPLDQFSIYFDAPKTKGRYPYLCTFPGHWMVMNGELIVE